MDDIQRINDQIKQSAHAAKIRQERENPQAKAERDFVNRVGENLFNRLMEFAKNAQPSFVGHESRAEKNSFEKPGNAFVPPVPSVTAPIPPQTSRSGVEGGSITFVACKDNGDDTYTQGKITAEATFVAS